MAPPPAAVDGKKPAFRCLNVTRKVVACAVVLLTIAVSLYAVVMVVRPGDLAVSVLGGSVSLATSNSQVPRLDVTIALDNHGGRGTIYYTGVTAVLVAPANNTIMNLSLGDIIVEPHSGKGSHLFPDLDGPNITSYGKMFFRNRNKIIIHGAELTLHGNLTINLYALHNRTSLPTTYTCSNVTVGGNPSDDVAGDDVECQKSAAAAKLCSSVFLVISLVLVISLTSG